MEFETSTSFEIQEDKENNLQKTLEIEFEQVEKDILPICNYFDPEIELESFKYMAREQKREALNNFKSKLGRQREAWATCCTFLKRKIEINYDVKKQDLMDWIDKFSTKYGFTEFQIQTAEEIIDDYYINRKIVKKIRKRYSNDVKLVNTIMGTNFNTTEKIKVSTGPMTIDIFCNSSTANKLYEKHKEKFNNRKFEPFAGFSGISNRTGQPIPFIIINTSETDEIGEEEVIKLHEYQHIENLFFANKFIADSNFSTRYGKYEKETDPEIKKILLESYLRVGRDMALVEVKDELIAMKKDERTFYKFDVLFTKQDNSSYDYISNFINQENSDSYKECSQKVLNKEYKKIIEDASNAFDQLKKTGGYSINKTIALLVDKPLTQWPKTVRRLLKEGRIKSF